MVRNKYFYYLFLLNATINLINFVPRVLIMGRYDGALMSMAVSIPIGMVLLVIFVKLISGSLDKDCRKSFTRTCPSGQPAYF